MLRGGAGRLGEVFYKKLRSLNVESYETVTLLLTLHIRVEFQMLQEMHNIVQTNVHI